MIGVVVGVGEFLGIGTKNVAMDMTAFNVVPAITDNADRDNTLPVARLAGSSNAPTRVKTAGSAPQPTVSRNTRRRPQTDAGSYPPVGVDPTLLAPKPDRRGRRHRTDARSPLRLDRQDAARSPRSCRPAVRDLACGDYRTTGR